MTIGDVATHTGLPPKTIRYCEDIGLVVPGRSDNGYRQFRKQHLHKLAFLGRAWTLGFTIEDCRTLLALYEGESRARSDVKRVAKTHLVKIETKIAGLQAMRDTLAHLVDCRAGDDRPDCPILRDLGGNS